MKDYKDKIRKLLALAHSPYEGEAKAALLKARELMAEHKLTEAECIEAAKQSVKDIKTEFTASKRRDPWLIPLSAAIGEHYCCKAYRTHYYGRQTQIIGFIGLEDDVELCVEIFAYAVSCVQSRIKEIRREMEEIYNAKYIRRECDSYGYGFTVGVTDAFERQQETKEQEWGLVLVIPKEVEEAAQHLGREEFKAAAEDNIIGRAYFDGMADGKDFDPSRVLKEAQPEPIQALMG